MLTFWSTDINTKQTVAEYATDLILFLCNIFDLLHPKVSTFAAFLRLNLKHKYY